MLIQNHYFIRIHGEVGWIYVLGFIDGQSAFINPLVPGDYVQYVNGHHLMRPITLEHYSGIYEALSDNRDPVMVIEEVLRSINI
ncbi:hypothetical protein ACFW4G_28050 [Paenibacillus lactis]|uniref:hypothetical protein n=1 Tax=Paenibacillus TaxID=44249 RepID=UPI0011A84BCF|nr:hypothetical protein [Paenibacillus sp. IHBB 10380]